MPRYEIRVMARQGPKQISIEAPDPKEAERIGSRQGRVTSVRRVMGLNFMPGMDPGERYIWMMRMSSMVSAKVSTAEALRLMAASFGGNIRRSSQSMLERIEAGFDLPSAMEQDRRNFPLTTTALVKAGVASGETWRALRDAADFEYKMSTIHKGSMKEVYSAIGSFLIAGALLLATTEYFGPMVMDNPMFKNAKGVDVEWSRTLGNVSAIIMMVLLVIFGILGWLATIGKTLLPVQADAVISRIPYYKDLVLARNNHLTLYKLGLLINSGVRIEEALKLTEESSPRGALKADLKRALMAVRSGKNWAAAMETLHQTDKAALSTSTDRKEIARTLDMLANQYSDLYIQRISTFAPTLGMISAIFMTIAGGVLFAQTILPMLQLSANVN